MFFGKRLPAITVITYTYDALYRLTAADYSTGEFYQYAYDAVGNRLGLVTGNGSTSYEYDAANRLTSVNGIGYTWDANGNLLSDGLRSYSYDHANRLAQVVSGTLTTQFAYNGAGDRVARTVDGVTTAYVLDPAAGLTQVLVESTGGQATTYLYGHDLLAQSDSGMWAYHVNDGLGSVRGLADPAGQVVQSYSFSPYGVPLGESGGEPYGFTGEQWDAEVELLYLRARYYSPETGTFLSRDLVEGEPPYLYVRANPINLTDPSGKQGGGDYYFSEEEICGSFRWGDRKLLCEPAYRDHDLDAMYKIWSGVAFAMYFKYPVAARHLYHFLKILPDPAPYRTREWLLNSKKERAMRDSLYQKLFDQLKNEKFGCCINRILDVPLETDFYDDEPTDQQLTFGSHKMKAGFTVDMHADCEITIDAKFSIDDTYDWRKKGEQTKLPIPYLGVAPGPGMKPPITGYLFILTTWADELADAGRAQEFDIHMEWPEKTETH